VTIRAFGATRAKPPFATGVAACAEPARAPAATTAAATALPQAIGSSWFPAPRAHHPIRTIRDASRPATLGGMGIRQWFSKQRKQADEDAVKRAEDEMRSGSYEEREDIAGDMEGMAADNRAARRGSMWSGRDVDPRL
jgi:hypothetical protein